jgi:hypothetical protein
MFEGGKKGDQMREKRVSTTPENPAARCASNAPSLYKVLASQEWRRGLCW